MGAAGALGLSSAASTDYPKCEHPSHHVCVFRALTCDFSHRQTTRESTPPSTFKLFYLLPPTSFPIHQSRRLPRRRVSVLSELPAGQHVPTILSVANEVNHGKEAKVGLVVLQIIALGN